MENVDKKLKRQMKMVLLAVGCLVFVFFLQDRLDAREQIRDGLERDGREAYEDSFVVRLPGGEKQEVDITVHPKRLDEDRCRALLEEAVKEFESLYLGANSSGDAVYTNLVFPASLCQGMVQAVYSTDAPVILWEDGQVCTEGLAREGQLVTIEVTFLCQQTEYTYVCYVNVVPAAAVKKDADKSYLEDLLAEEEQKSSSEDRFVLPAELDGQELVWSKKINPDLGIFALLGGVCVVCISQKARQEEQQKKRKREQILRFEYPQMVIQLSLLMGAGMTLMTAWEKMVKRYLQDQAESGGDRTCLYMEEMLITYREIKDGANIRRAYEEFGNRVGLSQYRKLSALLVQNMSKGTKDIVQVLDGEAQLAIEEQKRVVRKQGEEAGTRLLFPMLLLFLMVLIVIMVPALKSF